MINETNQETIDFGLKVRRFPYYTITIYSMIWIFYIYGIYIEANNTNISQLSPKIAKLWFISIDRWPSCANIKYQIWRLVTYQFIHNGMLHLFSNTLAGMIYGCILESYFIFGYIPFILIHQASIIVGAIAYGTYYPFEGLIGCSAGVYGIIGGCIVLVIMEYSIMNPLVVAITVFSISFQLIGDMIHYLYFYNPNIAVIAHVSGFLFGFTSMSIIYYNPKRNIKEKVLIIICICILLLQILYLLYNYCNQYSIDIFHESISRGSCCRDKLKLLSNGNSSSEAIAIQYLCYKNELVSYQELIN